MGRAADLLAHLFFAAKERRERREESLRSFAAEPFRAFRGSQKRVELLPNFLFASP
jgi:hypothetical protein